MLNSATGVGIPLVIGTGGGAGGAPHLDLIAGLARESAWEDGLDKVAELDDPLGSFQIIHEMF